jgi:hypothetical protein
MKKSSKVTLTLVATLGMAACNRSPDPCRNETFNDQACLQAVKDGGYHWNGSWVPMTYYFPYPHYYDSYRNYIENGGPASTMAPGAYGRPGDPSVTRGGFGETGAGHAAGE